MPGSSSSRPTTLSTMRSAGTTSSAPPNRKRSRAAIDRWLGDYRSQDVKCIAYGMVILRRRHGRNWIRADEVAHAPAAPAGDHVLQVFAGQTYLAGLKREQELLEAILRPAPGLRIDETRAFDRDRFSVAAAQVRAAEAVAVQPRLRPRTLDVLPRLDGRRRLGEVLSEIAEETGASLEATAADALPALRDLVALGLVVSDPRLPGLNSHQQLSG